jgi:hypothetical protein
MHVRTLSMAIGLVAVIAGACKGPVVPSPLTGQTRYLCCNVRYERPEITDNFYQVGALIPFGTPVNILEVRAHSVKFQASGHPPITVVEKYGSKTLPFDQFLDRLFLQTNPRNRVVRAVPAVRGRRAAPPRHDTLVAIEQGNVEPGMTKTDVIMALNYPPANRTPSLDASEWHYWRNRWNEYVIAFDGDRVSRVGP